MKLSIVSIFDRVAKLYSRPAFVQSNGAAIRSFGDEIRRNDPNNEMARHPGDYELQFLGYFDDDTGVLYPATPERISYGLDHVSQA